MKFGNERKIGDVEGNIERATICDIRGIRMGQS